MASQIQQPINNCVSISTVPSPMGKFKTVKCSQSPGPCNCALGHTRNDMILLNLNFIFY